VKEDERARRLDAARFGVLAATLLLTIGAVMVAAPLVHGSIRPVIVISVPLLVGLWVVSRSARLVASGALVIVMAGAIGVFSRAERELLPLIIDVGLRAGVLAYVTFWLAAEVARQTRVSLDTILGGICVYLLIAFCYAHVYLALHLADSGSLVAGGKPLDAFLDGQHPFRAIPDILYFSYATLSTVAYGDITPATPLARFVAITEGIFGQLYPTIFIARLVSLNIAQRQEYR